MPPPRIEHSSHPSLHIYLLHRHTQPQTHTQTQTHTHSHTCIYIHTSFYLRSIFIFLPFMCAHSRHLLLTLTHTITDPHTHTHSHTCIYIYLIYNSFHLRSIFIFLPASSIFIIASFMLRLFLFVVNFNLCFLVLHSFVYFLFRVRAPQINPNPRRSL